MQWPTSSTTDHAKHWTGPSQANGSSNFSMPWNTLNKAYNHNDVLQRPLESTPLGMPPPENNVDDLFEIGASRWGEI